MLEYIRGRLIEITSQKVIVDVGGMGYALLIPLSTYLKTPPLGQEVFFYISTVIRENSHRNFGFLTREERDLFEQLSTVTGIGPKTALALIGHMERDVFEEAVMTANVSLLAKIPSIGQKTAERLIIELKDKIEKNHKRRPVSVESKQSSLEASTIHDAASALIHLGYNGFQAQQAIKQALTHFTKEPPELSALIKVALKGI